MAAALDKNKPHYNDSADILRSSPETRQPGETMNFLVSGNHETVLQFQAPLRERGELEWLVTFSEVLPRVSDAGSGLVIIDANVPGYEGETSIKRLKQLNPSLKVLLVGLFPPQKELASLASGAMGCCSPALDAEQVRRILAIVEEGGVWISNAALPQLLQRLRQRSEKVSPPTVPPQQSSEALLGLTQREREIAKMVAAGDSNKIIARKLNITDRTVKAHLITVFQKLNVHDRLQLALFVSKGSQ
jgi:two-component system nitrate/nitrite response regulator NarL